MLQGKRIANLHHHTSINGENLHQAILWSINTSNDNWKINTGFTQTKKTKGKGNTGKQQKLQNPKMRGQDRLSDPTNKLKNDLIWKKFLTSTYRRKKNKKDKNESKSTYAP